MFNQFFRQLQAKFLKDKKQLPSYNLEQGLNEYKMAYEVLKDEISGQVILTVTRLEKYEDQTEICTAYHVFMLPDAVAQTIATLLFQVSRKDVEG